MSSQDNVPFSFCRVVGLTSSEGKKRNGSAAKVNLDRQMVATGDTRHPVCIDGFPGPMSIKASNIEVFPNEREVAVGVGRGTLLDTTCRATLVENSQIIDEAMITGGAARSKGNLEAMGKLIQGHWHKNTDPILIQVTDLNIARAMNRAALGENVKLAPPLKTLFEKIKKNLPKNGGKGDNKKVLFKFLSHRVHPDGFDIKTKKLGPQRHEAVKTGAYQIYPCALKQYMDALEVRYFNPNRKEIVINHEIYLDYGVEEATAYPRHAASLEESFRLFPSVLAEADPQAFWSAILWLEPFTQTLEELNLSSELVAEWKAFETGKKTSKNQFQKCTKLFGLESTLAKGADENWGISKSQDVHLRIATDYAVCALEAVQACLPAASPNISSVKLHTLDYYIGTELDNYIMGRHQFLEMARKEEEEKGTKLSLDRRARLLDKAMKSAGFKKGSTYRIQDPEKVCDNCGKKSKTKLQACARCEGVSYCNAKCQHDHWKQHRPHCSRVLVQVYKQMAELNINGEDGPKIEAGEFKSGSLPTGPAMLSEVSGLGMMSIFWNPGSTSFINMTNVPPTEAGLSSLTSSTELDKDEIKFTDFSELHPTTRFLVCCGPLPQLEIAQQCASEAIRLCDGNIEELRVPNVGFTALEWAAKKGNTDIVNWLCTDERTKPLILIGCPVGWAGYTGKIEIMRLLVSYGADPGKTDVVLWGATPPLLVAAQNGQIDALKFFVEECKQDVAMVDSHGKNILKHIKDSPNWRELPGHVASHKWAKELLRGTGKK